MTKLSKDEKDRLYARLYASTKDPAKILDDCADSMNPQSVLKIASELQIELTQEQAKEIADDCSLFNGNIAILLATTKEEAKRAYDVLPLLSQETKDKLLRMWDEQGNEDKVKPPLYVEHNNPIIREIRSEYVDYFD